MFWIPLLLLAYCISPVQSSAALISPPSRGMMWTLGYNTSVNYNYMGLNCGGIKKLRELGGYCGVCGDPFDSTRDHELGGKYATGIIRNIYREGTRHILVKILSNAFQRGFFEFRLCVADNTSQSQSCFDRHLLSIEEGRRHGNEKRFFPRYAGLVHLNVEVPADLACDHCVLQWRYRTGHNWGRDEEGRGCLGCGIQEEYVNCADIRILGASGPRPDPNSTGSVSASGSPSSDNGQGLDAGLNNSEAVQHGSQGDGYEDGNNGSEKADLAGQRKHVLYSKDMFSTSVVRENDQKVKPIVASAKRPAQKRPGLSSRRWRKTRRGRQYRGRETFRNIHRNFGARRRRPGLKHRLRFRGRPRGKRPSVLRNTHNAVSSMHGKEQTSQTGRTRKSRVQATAQRRNNSSPRKGTALETDSPKEIPVANHNESSVRQFDHNQSVRFRNFMAPSEIRSSRLDTKRGSMRHPNENPTKQTKGTDSGTPKYVSERTRKGKTNSHSLESPTNGLRRPEVITYSPISPTRPDTKQASQNEKPNPSSKLADELNRQLSIKFPTQRVTVEKIALQSKKSVSSHPAYVSRSRQQSQQTTTATTLGIRAYIPYQKRAPNHGTEHAGKKTPTGSSSTSASRKRIKSRPPKHGLTTATDKVTGRGNIQLVSTDQGQSNARGTPFNKAATSTPSTVTDQAARMSKVSSVSGTLKQNSDLRKPSHSDFDTQNLQAAELTESGPPLSALLKRGKSKPGHGMQRLPTESLHDVRLIDGATPLVPKSDSPNSAGKVGRLNSNRQDNKPTGKFGDRPHEDLSVASLGVNGLGKETSTAKTPSSVHVNRTGQNGSGEATVQSSGFVKSSTVGEKRKHREDLKVVELDAHSATNVTFKLKSSSKSPLETDHSAVDKVVDSGLGNTGDIIAVPNTGKASGKTATKTHGSATGGSSSKAVNELSNSSSIEQPVRANPSLTPVGAVSENLPSGLQWLGRNYSSDILLIQDSYTESTQGQSLEVTDVQINYASQAKTRIEETKSAKRIRQKAYRENRAKASKALANKASSEHTRFIKQNGQTAKNKGITATRRSNVKTITGKGTFSAVAQNAISSRKQAPHTTLEQKPKNLTRTFKQKHGLSKDIQQKQQKSAGLKQSKEQQLSEEGTNQTEILTHMQNQSKRERNLPNVSKQAMHVSKASKQRNGLPKRFNEETTASKVKEEGRTLSKSSNVKLDIPNDSKMEQNPSVIAGQKQAMFNGTSTFDKVKKPNQQRDETISAPAASNGDRHMFSKNVSSVIDDLAAYIERKLVSLNPGQTKYFGPVNQTVVRRILKGMSNDGFDKDNMSQTTNKERQSASGLNGQIHVQFETSVELFPPDKTRAIDTEESLIKAIGMITPSETTQTTKQISSQQSFKRTDIHQTMLNRHRVNSTKASVGTRFETSVKGEAIDSSSSKGAQDVHTTIVTSAKTENPFNAPKMSSVQRKSRKRIHHRKTIEAQSSLDASLESPIVNPKVIQEKSDVDRTSFSNEGVVQVPAFINITGDFLGNKSNIGRDATDLLFDLIKDHIPAIHPNSSLFKQPKGIKSAKHSDQMQRKPNPREGRRNSAPKLTIESKSHSAKFVGKTSGNRERHHMATIPNGEDAPIHLDQSNVARKSDLGRQEKTISSSLLKDQQTRDKYDPHSNTIQGRSEISLGGPVTSNSIVTHAKDTQNPHPGTVFASGARVPQLSHSTVQHDMSPNAPEIDNKSRHTFRTHASGHTEHARLPSRKSIETGGAHRTSLTDRVREGQTSHIENRNVGRKARSNETTDSKAHTDQAAASATMEINGNVRFPKRKSKVEPMQKGKPITSVRADNNRGRETHVPLSTRAHGPSNRHAAPPSHRQFKAGAVIRVKERQTAVGVVSNRPFEAEHRAGHHSTSEQSGHGGSLMTRDNHRPMSVDRHIVHEHAHMVHVAGASDDSGQHRHGAFDDHHGGRSTSQGKMEVNGDVISGNGNDHHGGHSAIRAKTEVNGDVISGNGNDNHGGHSSIRAKTEVNGDVISGNGNDHHGGHSAIRAKTEVNGDVISGNGNDHHGGHSSIRAKTEVNGDVISGSGNSHSSPEIHSHLHTHRVPGIPMGHPQSIARRLQSVHGGQASAEVLSPQVFPIAAAQSVSWSGVPREINNHSANKILPATNKGFLRHVLRSLGVNHGGGQSVMVIKNLKMSGKQGESSKAAGSSVHGIVHRVRQLLARNKQLVRKSGSNRQGKRNFVVVVPLNKQAVMTIIKDFNKRRKGPLITN